MFLALQESSRTIDDVAGAYDITRNHMMKVVQRLAGSVYINSPRGRGGGLQLQRAPADINVGKVMREMESMESFVECYQAADLVKQKSALQHIFAGSV